MASLGLGLWLGLPGRYEQTQEDLEDSLANPKSRPKLKKRAVSPLAWVQRRASQSALRGRNQRGRGISLDSPDFPKK